MQEHLTPSLIKEESKAERGELGPAELNRGKKQGKSALK